MTDEVLDRRTIIAPLDLMGAVNAALGLSMNAALWQDGHGNPYAAASYLSTDTVGTDDLPNLPVVIFSHEMPLVLSVGHVHVVNGRDGASALEELGLSAAGPDLP